MRSTRYQGAIIQDHHILLLKQTEHASGRSYWQIPGGRIEPDESDDRLRLTYLVMHAELEGLICSGAMRGKQHTYALLDDRVQATRMLERQDALAVLCDATGGIESAPAMVHEGTTLPEQ